MIGILGNHNGAVKPWYLPLDLVFARISINYRLRVIVVRNGRVPNIYGLPVEIVDRRVTRILPKEERE